jgi:hypothetical protein
MNKNIANRIKKLAEVNMNIKEVLNVYPNTGAPPGYTATKHLTPNAVAYAKNVLSRIGTLPYGHVEYFSDTKNGKNYNFVAKVEPHLNSLKGVSIYELKEGATPEESSQPITVDNAAKPDTSIKNTPLTGKVVPEKGKFREQFASLQGQDRESFVLDYVSKYIDKLPMQELKISDPNDPSKFVVVEVQPQYFSIEDEPGKPVPVQISAATAEKISKLFEEKNKKKYSLPTKEIIDELHKGQAMVLPFSWQEGRLGPDSKKLLDYSDLVAQQLANIDPNKFVVGPLKDKTLPSENKNLHSTGIVGSSQPTVILPNGEKLTVLELINKYHTDPTYAKYEAIVKEEAKKLKRIQDFQGSTMHDSSYTDYSEGTRYVGDVTLPDGSKIALKDLLEKSKSDPSLKPYADILSKGKNYTSYIDDNTKLSSSVSQFKKLSRSRRFNILDRINIYNSIKKI